MLDKYSGKIKRVVKHFPLTRHKYARKAAQAALAAGAQGKFREFHRSLLANYRSLNDDKIRKIAQDLALDMEKFENTMKSPAIQRQINQDISDGRKIGVRGTPTIFINGKLLKNKSVQGFYQKIEVELKRNS